MSIKKSRKGRKPFYEQAFKSAVCFEILSGNLSYSEARTVYGIKGQGTIPRWVKQYQNQSTSGNLHSMSEKDLNADSMDPAEGRDKSDLQKKNHELVAALKMAKLKITALETMIDIAESDLNIDIRKKSGTKQ